MTHLRRDDNVHYAREQLEREFPRGTLVTAAFLGIFKTNGNVGIVKRTWRHARNDARVDVLWLATGKVTSTPPRFLERIEP